MQGDVVAVTDGKTIGVFDIQKRNAEVNTTVDKSREEISPDTDDIAAEGARFIGNKKTKVLHSSDCGNRRKKAIAFISTATKTLSQGDIRRTKIVSAKNNFTFFEKHGNFLIVSLVI